ncbi:(Fe-S)-binding protein [Thalassospira lucentensis]|uniref:(Fe-S)-binding protein n=1 Tax=Thalassospira lucentensis TaxID=168935 RepID=A0A154L075_9PROT|nr:MULTISPECIES: aromatic ring-hydroxylating dioxygenase subunit alpha [Thalassospira]KZB60500.1 (Fe-S)-binding protein [Thalassospira lucentensis]MAZ31548.1 (Fe-S)-binding protein [Thalassospira sp.]MCK2169052.1 aromatic ring-hydroxylating dioxygenase subunit alpha [Thalassospira xiamenensis]
MRFSSDIQDLVSRREKGKSLEAPFYNAPEILKLDVEAIFNQHWIFVAVEPELPEPGDCITVEVGRASILLLRGDDMEIRAFHNVCRHRGAKLIDERATTIGNIVCRYHGWTYNEDGDLILAEHMGAGFDKSCHGLKAVHIRSIAGLIFICLADEAPKDIDEMARVMTPYIAPHDIANCKVAFTSDLIEEGNWKLTMENNRECYHCEANHPQLTVPLSEFGFGFSPDEMDERRSEDVKKYTNAVENDHKRWESCGLPSAEEDHLSDVTGFRTMRLPLMWEGESQTLDTKVASKKLLGKFTDPKLGGLSFWTHPNSWHHFMSDHIVTFSVLPLSADRTLVRTTWLVHKDAIEGEDYNLDNLTQVWKMTNQQDADLVRLAQLGSEQPSYEPGPYSSFTEPHVEAFCDWYIARMKQHLAKDKSGAATK